MKTLTIEETEGLEKFLKNVIEYAQKSTIIDVGKCYIVHLEKETIFNELSTRTYEHSQMSLFKVRKSNSFNLQTEFYYPIPISKELTVIFQILLKEKKSKHLSQLKRGFDELKDSINKQVDFKTSLSKFSFLAN